MKEDEYDSVEKCPLELGATKDSSKDRKWLVAFQIKAFYGHTFNFYPVFSNINRLHQT